jgi:hypothetical protein
LLGRLPAYPSADGSPSRAECDKLGGKKKTMKFEIKHRISGAIIFSLETETFKLCVEAAVQQKLDLRYSDLSGSNLRGSDLRGSNLRYSNLSGSNLSGSDLRGSDLRYSDLRGSNLRGSDLRYSDLRGSKGINKNLITPLRILLDQPGPIWAYKLVKENGEGPFNGGINYLDPAKDEFSIQNLNTDEAEQYGAGINLASLDWVMKEWKPGYRILVMEFFANEPTGNLVIPTATDGKFRVKECRRVGEKDLKELGLIP